MPPSRPGLLRRLFGAIWNLVDTTRRFLLNTIFLLLLVIILVAWFAGGKPKLADNTALVLELKGDVVEQYTGSAREAELAQALGGEARETQLRDVVAALDTAAKDPKIPRAVLLLDDMGNAGMPKLREIAAALDRFRAAGKQVVAWGSVLQQRQYFLAAHADEVYLHPSGFLILKGLGGYRNYYHDGLERLGVTVNVFRVGKFKSFVEPFTSNGPSKEAQEADTYWLNDAWTTYTSDVESARKLPPGAIERMINDLPARLVAVGGDAAALALKEKLVDGLKTRDQLRALMIERGARDVEHKTFRQVSLGDYRDTVPDSGDRHRQVGVVVAAGEISDGDEPQGKIGGRTTAELVRKARDDDTIKAIVLRVDSPGGSAFGAELIRRELELTRLAGKPVVVSMSDVAASGGYWISTAADEVFADPATITGSIGVFGMLPTVDKTLDKLGLHTGGVTTTWLAGAQDLRRPLDPRFGEVMQAFVEHTYKEFLAHAAQARHATPDEINEVAQGRVWTGRQARERHLVDNFGGISAAIAAAAQRAKLEEGFHVTYVETEPHGWDRFLGLLPSTLAPLAAQVGAKALPETAILEGSNAMALVRDDWAWVRSMMRAPGTVSAHCLCKAP